MIETFTTGSASAEKVSFFDDPATGLRAIIVIHSTALGPAAGGCRFWSYAQKDDAIADASRLAEGMTYKNALAGLPFGGGKAVIMRPEGEFDREALFKAFGKAVDSLGGNYITAEDVGTHVSDMQAVHSVTRHVAGLPSNGSHAGGDPSPWTALGVFLSLRHAVERRLGGKLAGRTVAVQGVGNVGMELCRLLHQDGAHLVVADGSAERAAKAAHLYGAVVVRPEDVLSADVDVVAPCALGAVLNERSIENLKAKVVCGAANNQLAVPEDGRRLAARGILYAPDYLVNAGGIINVVAEKMGEASAAVDERVCRIPERLAAVFDAAEASGEGPNFVADAMARTIVAEARPRARRVA
ncbi:Glu/Leu/Phe/Val dehydrogenase dimerization domain-containing protein [Mesorhizobium sp. YR577]|uniref:Glu/Leu/Phe/Val family dehydrogenase n=1 Tax=Mesorhizobium sp. YR577 TaxID=1884373 RepID=UPI0008E147C9|nr:Glu/Leu/Phe/Val dehydrogenase dimerization domain-containing protein [Mesorhizobium sp. YR577]SFT84139.1 leucine dehydrogenase [Mesorhizobium sp. YR577]